MNCAICETRKPRRHCPAVQGDICSLCCGTGREESLDCPLECEYLHDAHEHENKPEFDPATLPNKDIEISEEFLGENEIVMAFLAISIFEGSLKVTGATDWDVREALDALIATYRTLQTGLYYETVPDNRFAASISAHVKEKLDEIKQKEIEETGASSIADSTLLSVLVFLQRLEYSHNNGRKRSRAFLDFLRGFYIPSQEMAGIGEGDGDGGLIAQPGEPKLIL